MKKILQCTLLLSIFTLISLFSTYCLATTENLENYTPAATNTTTSTEFDYTGYKTVITQGNLPESQLGITNILLILILVVGIVIVLLAIAILIRLKH